MRDIGYSLETALADVIDNSITAGARTIRVDVDANADDPVIAISDDGQGMTRAELLDAMRLGSRHPSQVREQRDLGRFGLGLKTASLSQCRKLTVVARKGGETNAACWDLEEVANRDTWALVIPERPESIPFSHRLNGDGVLIVWQHLDRAYESQGGDSARRHFVRRMDETREHLELVFHRFLAGEAGVRRVEISVNELPLTPFDPFHSSHPATIHGSKEPVAVRGYQVEITPYTLPHHRNVTPQEWDRYAGRAGYLKNQGFYLYREKRLIVHGTWFGLARQTELTKLARVRIDMPNALDADWHVDVKKSSARPPLAVRERLQRIIGEMGAPSRRIYTRRGQRLHDTRLPVWERVQHDNAIVYRVSDSNPVIARFAHQLPLELQKSFRDMLTAVSAGLPMDAIFADLAGAPESVKTAQVTDEQLRDFLEVTYSQLSSMGVEESIIAEMLRTAEPYRTNW